MTGPLRAGAALLCLSWTVSGIGATAGSMIAGLARRLPVWPVLVAVTDWGAALTPLGLPRLPVPALTCFTAGGLLYAPYPAQHTLQASAAATIATGLAATAILNTRRRLPARPEARRAGRGERSRSKEYVRNPF